MLISDLDNILASDEEEYKDDEILKDLRQRRKLYLLKLQAIDAALAEVAEK